MRDKRSAWDKISGGMVRFGEIKSGSNEASSRTERMGAELWVIGGGRGRG